MSRPFTRCVGSKNERYVPTPQSTFRRQKTVHLRSFLLTLRLLRLDAFLGAAGGSCWLLPGCCCCCCCVESHSRRLIHILTHKHVGAIAARHGLIARVRRIVATTRDISGLRLRIPSCCRVAPHIVPCVGGRGSIPGGTCRIRSVAMLGTTTGRPVQVRPGALRAVARMLLVGRRRVLGHVRRLARHGRAAQVVEGAHSTSKKQSANATTASYRGCSGDAIMGTDSSQ
ncbi:hypothetical protein BCR44DRAFT_1285406 [Catenaria anguillulae PL171]|uniref:Uncharacterized protein n=1 Tax=Catenaria anguillulae PL171 TaxID=765915 RepID=A0A1Y2I0T3_9FUNG|nr:hypothetical protein BCR44DRAFT_1285406 [Catenaria anguillulae PL171]